MKTLIIPHRFAETSQTSLEKVGLQTGGSATENIKESIYKDLVQNLSCD
jgi:hypothetical protein